MKMNFIKSALAVVVIFLFLMSGCGSEGQMTAPTTIAATSSSSSSTTLSSTSTSSTTTTTLKPEQVGAISLTPDSLNLYADGVSTTTIKAVVRNTDDLNMSKTVKVFFSTTAGTLSVASADTVQGVASVILKSQNSTGSATITALADNITGKTTVKFIPIPKDFSLSLSQSTVKSDNSDSTVITATVLDDKYVPIQGATVLFSSEGGQISASNALSDANGRATIIFSSGTVQRANAIIKVTASVLGLPPKEIPVQIVGTRILLSTDKTSLEIGGDNTTTLTITVLDAGSQPIFLAPVKIIVKPESAINLSPASPYFTDVSGVLKLTLTGNLPPATTPPTATVYVISMGVGDNPDKVGVDPAKLVKQDYTVSALGSAFRISSPSLDINGFAAMTTENKTPIVVKAPDPNTKKITFSTTYGYWTLAGDPTLDKTKLSVDVSVVNGEASAILNAPESFKLTDLYFDNLKTDGVPDNIISLLRGLKNQVYLTKEKFFSDAKTTIGDAAYTTYGSVIQKYAPPAFKLTDLYFSKLATDGVSNNIITVLKGLQNQVYLTVDKFFSDAKAAIGDVDYTTYGSVIQKDVLFLVNTPLPTPGVATVQVYDLDKPSTSYIIKMVISAPIEDAQKISLQGSSTIVALSTGDTKNSISLKATVKTATDQVVAFAPVAFSLSRTTGGGEFISPVIAYTDYYGVAQSTFYSGSLSSGPTGVLITASVQNKSDVNSQISIVIGGTAGSLIIGRSTVVATQNNDTAYKLPMSVLVVDSNGNAVPGAQVSLSAWPNRYAIGYWVTCPAGCCPYYLSKNANEDTNRNLILDPGEDILRQGQLTPPASAAGAIVIQNADGTVSSGPSGVVTTNSNGVGEFYLVYLKGLSAWIEDEITAATLVMGSETRSTYTFFLPYLGSDASSCVLPDSPYNTQTAQGEITLTASPSVLLADGNSTSTITAWVTTISGYPIVDNTRVNFAITSGDGTDTDGLPYNRSSWSYTSKGTATAIYKASKKTGTVEITVSAAGTKTAKTYLSLKNGTISIVSDKTELIADGETTANISATLLDMDGLPVSDYERVNFTLVTGGGIITCPTCYSGTSTYSAYTIGGVATATYHSPTTSGKVTIKATSVSLGISATTDINLIKLPPAGIKLSDITTGNPNPSMIAVKGTGGQATSQILFDVFDALGKPVADGYRVNFIISGPNGGELVYPPFAVTATTGTGTLAIKGRVGTIVRSGYKSGPVTVKAICADDSAVNTTVSKISIAAGPPVGESFWLSKSSCIMSDFTVGNITVTAADSWGNAIPENTSISFNTYNTGGIINPASVLIANGKACTLFNLAGAQPLGGVSSVTAEAMGGSTTHITSLSVYRDITDNHILFAGTNGGGVYKSTDAGATWRNLSGSSEASQEGQNFIDPYVNDIMVDPENTDVIYAVTGYGSNGHVYRSLDGGLNWNSNNVNELKDGLGKFNSAALCVLVDDGKDSRGNKYVWIGTESDGIIRYPTTTTTTIASVTTTSATTTTTLPFSRTIKSIVKEPGTHADSAVLVAGTATGAFKSINGGRIWTKTGNFSGINILDLHPDTFIIYAGTEDSGVWASADIGSSWSAQPSGGLGTGFATLPIASSTNKGTGSMSKVTVYPSVQSENWTVKCKSKTIDPVNQLITFIFSVVGTVSGPQPDDSITYNTVTGITTGKYSIIDVMDFTITNESISFEVGDTFTFSTTLDSGRNIRAILIDPTNYKLYAVTYFKGALEPHPVGNVYVHDLNSDGSMSGDWQQANAGLPQYDPPDDTTLLGQHAIAREIDRAGMTSAMYIGGEGINFYKARTGLGRGELPTWQVSKSGLTNRIMVRTIMP